jgi:hypothetical protein
MAGAVFRHVAVPEYSLAVLGGTITKVKKSTQFSEKINPGMDSPMFPN